MRKINAKHYEYLGSSKFPRVIVIEVDDDDNPLYGEVKNRYLHHFVNRSHRDEIITVGECIYIQEDGQDLIFNLNICYNLINTDYMYNKFLDEIVYK